MSVLTVYLACFSVFSCSSVNIFSGWQSYKVLYILGPLMIFFCLSSLDLWQSYSIFSPSRQQSQLRSHTPWAKPHSFAEKMQSPRRQNLQKVCFDGGNYPQSIQYKFFDYTTFKAFCSFCIQPRRKDIFEMGYTCLDVYNYMTKARDWKATIVWGLVIRVALIFFLSTYESIYNQEMTFTDIDYKVYSDSTLYDSPYDRHTYRYTPIISYLMRFNYTVHEAIGKVFFALFDVVAMVFLYAIFSKEGSNNKGHSNYYANLAVKIYAYNPLFIALTVRGSCQSIALALMYAFWYYYFGGETTGNQSCLHITNNKINQTQPDAKMKWISYIIYGLWVHVRVYPIILLPLLLFHQYEARNKNWKALVKLFVQLGIGAGGVFLGLGLFFYSIYGFKFVEETYLYHSTRLDNRHSFSPFFYEIYLNFNNDAGSVSRSLIRVIPSIYIILSTLKFLRGYSAFYLHFLAVYAFVSFNKVITLQYYMWIFGALILALPESLIFAQKRFRMGYGLILQYILPIVIWIWLSIRLENEGENNLHVMWLICLFQIYMHLWVLTSFMKTVRCYNPAEEKKMKLEAAKKLLAGKQD